MTTTGRAYERLVAANPIPDADRYAAAAVPDVDAALRELARGEDLNGSHPRILDHRPRPRWAVAVAALLIVLAAGGTFLLTTAGERDVAGGSPLEVVNSFFTKWNERDIEGTMALVHPDASINVLQSAPDLRGLIEWTMEFEGAMETSCSDDLQPDRITCEWAFVSPATEALGISDPREGTFAVTDGVIVDISTPNYMVLEMQLSSFARDRDPTGYGDACGFDRASPRSIYGFPFNQRCGRFLAGIEAEFVASRTD